MEIITICFSILYACLLFLATIKIIRISEYPVIFLCNMLGVLLTVLCFSDYRFLYLGMIILFASALLKGHFILEGGYFLSCTYPFVVYNRHP
ncbi:hypothetical protein IGI37_002067 [Enterococcus sp. AZ194]|uniref:hypothetical protein n=1 Tax=Enterococcus sp. AZ194 TaxID=2774629 RepID=UPI003F20CBFC